jgi:hypothetical protein
MTQCDSDILPEFLMSLSKDFPQLRISSNVGLGEKEKKKK